MKVIVFTNESGGVSVCTPAIECGLPIEEIALKDVPHGAAYKIIDDSELPADNIFFAAWELDATNPDGIGADYGSGSTNEVIGWDENNKPIIKELV